MTTKTPIKRMNFGEFQFHFGIIFMVAWVNKKEYTISDPETRHIYEASKFDNI